MYFEVYQDVVRQWRWRLKGGNHEIFAVSEGYTSKANALHAVNLVKSSTYAPVHER